MSRIGKLPVKIPSGVTVTVQDHSLSVKGGKAELVRQLNPDMKVTVNGDTVVVERPSESKTHRSLHGLTRTLVWNMIEGVSKGYEKQLELVGVGYRASRQGEALVLNVGYSHPVRYPVPNGITIDVPEPTRINIKGASKEDVGQVAAEVRKIRPPEPYKGKGILYRGERIRRKAGKTGKTGAGAGGGTLMYKVPNRRGTRIRRHTRLRGHLEGGPIRPRLAVFRSLHHVYAQIIDDASGRTLVAAGTTDAELRKSVKSPSGAQGAAAVGKSIAERALQSGIETVVFDRGGFPYHGRVKALAEAARGAGLKF